VSDPTWPNPSAAPSGGTPPPVAAGGPPPTGYATGYPSVPVMPQATPRQRLRMAVTARNDTDYYFEFWSAFGWTLLTCGIYGLYVTYQLMQRSVRHNQRRIEVLDATTAILWEQAVNAGRGDELTPWFQAVGAPLAGMRQITTEFRDPAMWTLITAFTGGIGTVLRDVFLDKDLVQHEAAERAAEDQLAALAAALGTPVTLYPAPPPKGPHNVGGRVLALFGSCGLYGLWWLNDIMVQGNQNHAVDRAREDALLVGLGA
jgi:hypothetical protein